jgi:subtilisin family serine protease
MKTCLRLKRLLVIFVVLSILIGNLFVIQITAEENNSEPPDQLGLKQSSESTLILNRNNAKESLDIDPLEPEIKSSGYSVRDQNNNKISDTLDSWITKGYPVLDIIVMYDRELSNDDISHIEALNIQISKIYWYFDMIALCSVPVSLFSTITELPGVLRLENHGSPVLYSDIATPAVKARESDLFSPFTAWELGYQGKGVNIAIVDTGADNGHPTLAGKWVAGADISKPETFFTPRDGTFDADDTNGHGTTCSGIAMGTGAPDQIYMGAAPEAKLVDVRIGTMIGYAPGELLQDYYDASLEGIEWVIAHHDDSWSGAGNENEGIDILSLSWGIDVGGASDGSDPYSRAIDRATEAGVIVSHAAGNSGPSNSGFDGFAAASNCISVASSDDLDTITRNDDIIAEYSSRGPRHDNGDNNLYNELKPDITAPGTHINQAQFDIMGDGSGNGYGNRGSGTSYAAPVIAGVCALMLEANPNLTPELIREILHLTAERRGEPSIPDLDPIWNKDFGYGIVDAYKAVNVSANLNNIDDIDIDLQCYITEIVGVSGNESMAAGEIIINGVAFSKQGQEIEKIEIAFDDGKWKVLKDKDIEEDGIYYGWQLKYDTNKLSNGKHSIKVRALGGEHQSLEHSLEILILNTKITEEGGTTKGYSTALIGLGILVAGVAIFVYFYNKKQKSNSQ